MENLTVEQLKAMSPEEVAKLTAQQKATRTKMINAAKDATPKSGALKNDILNKAAQESAGNGAVKAPANTPAPPADQQPPADNQNPPPPSDKGEHKVIQVPVDTIIAPVGNTGTGPGADFNQGNTGNGPGNSPESLEELNLRLQNEAIEAEEVEEKRLIDKYGPGYIKATNGQQSTIFSATAWGMLGKDKNGWKPQVKEPVEVANFKKGGK